MTCEEAETLIEGLQHAVDCAEQAVGEDFAAATGGAFWPQVAMRPYLRTLKQLAEVLWRVGRRFDAVACYERLVDLMAGDEDAAREALDLALADNPHVIEYLFGEVPEELDVMPTVPAGGPAEARVCVQVLGGAWERNPQQMLWLHETLVELRLLSPPGPSPWWPASPEDEPPPTAH